MTNNLREKEKLPQHPFFALTLLVGIAWVAAFFIPSGEYVREVVDGITQVDPSSYTVVDKIFPGIDDLFLAFYNGFLDAGSITAMVLFVGGGFGVVKATGLMDVTVKSLVRKLKKYGVLPLMICIMLLMAGIINFTGIWELSIVVIPLVVPLCISLGYDDMTGIGMVLAGNCVALGTALANPFATAVGQEIAELPIYSGIGYRLMAQVILYIPVIFFVYRYANKVKKDPTKSITYGDVKKYEAIEDDGINFSTRQKISGMVFLAIFVFMIYGTLSFGWSFPEMSACFVAIALFVGLSYGYSINKICYLFADGMSELMVGAFVMFFARAVLYILETTLIIDTVINFLSQFFVGTNSIVAAGMVFLVQSLINFIIPSGSGQAVITLPVMVPLGDMAGMTRQVTHFAFQMGDGLSNIFWPTNGALVAILSVAGITWSKWFKFFAPLFAALVGISLVLVMFAQYINLGPI